MVTKKIWLIRPSDVMDKQDEMAMQKISEHVASGNAVAAVDEVFAYFKRIMAPVIASITSIVGPAVYSEKRQFSGILHADKAEELEVVRQKINEYVEGGKAEEAVDEAFAFHKQSFIAIHASVEETLARLSLKHTHEAEEEEEQSTAKRRCIREAEKVDALTNDLEQVNISKSL